MHRFRVFQHPASDAGAAYLFDAGTGALLQTFLNPTPAANDEFGWSVAISGDNVLVGAHGDDTGAENAGAAYLCRTISAVSIPSQAQVACIPR